MVGVARNVREKRDGVAEKRDGVAEKHDGVAHFDDATAVGDADGAVGDVDGAVEMQENEELADRKRGATFGGSAWEDVSQDAAAARVEGSQGDTGVVRTADGEGGVQKDGAAVLTDAGGRAPGSRKKRRKLGYRPFLAVKGDAGNDGEVKQDEQAMEVQGEGERGKGTVEGGGEQGLGNADVGVVDVGAAGESRGHGQCTEQEEGREGTDADTNVQDLWAAMGVRSASEGLPETAEEVPLSDRSAGEAVGGLAREVQDSDGSGSWGRRETRRRATRKAKARRERQGMEGAGLSGQIRRSPRLRLGNAVLPPLPAIPEEGSGERDESPGSERTQGNAGGAAEREEGRTDTAAAETIVLSPDLGGGYGRYNGEHEEEVGDAGEGEGQGDAGEGEGQGDAGEGEGQGDAGEGEGQGDAGEGEGQGDAVVGDTGLEADSIAEALAGRVVGEGGAGDSRDGAGSRVVGGRKGRKKGKKGKKKVKGKKPSPAVAAAVADASAGGIAGGRDETAGVGAEGNFVELVVEDDDDVQEVQVNRELEERNDQLEVGPMLPRTTAPPCMLHATTLSSHPCFSMRDPCSCNAPCLLPSAAITATAAVVGCAISVQLEEVDCVIEEVNARSLRHAQDGELPGGDGESDDEEADGEEEDEEEDGEEEEEDGEGEKEGVKKEGGEEEMSEEGSKERGRSSRKEGAGEDQQTRDSEENKASEEANEAGAEREADEEEAEGGGGMASAWRCLCKTFPGLAAALDWLHDDAGSELSLVKQWDEYLDIGSWVLSHKPSGFEMVFGPAPDAVNEVGLPPASPSPMDHQHPPPPAAAAAGSGGGDGDGEGAEERKGFVMRVMTLGRLEESRAPKWMRDAVAEDEDEYCMCCESKLIHDLRALRKILLH
ncbi:unnamed protein product [Closterium sp. Yama58-4]|nr:unnamed protein product [Closterium sp. Yama58-4]